MKRGDRAMRGPMRWSCAVLVMLQAACGGGRHGDGGTGPVTYDSVQVLVIALDSLTGEPAQGFAPTLWVGGRFTSDPTRTWFAPGSRGEYRVDADDPFFEAATFPFAIDAAPTSELLRQDVRVMPKSLTIMRQDWRSSPDSSVARLLLRYPPGLQANLLIDSLSVQVERCVRFDLSGCSDLEFADRFTVYSPAWDVVESAGDTLSLVRLSLRRAGWPTGDEPAFLSWGVLFQLHLHDARRDFIILGGGSLAGDQLVPDPHEPVQQLRP